jgi:hypothetical protein
VLSPSLPLLANPAPEQFEAELEPLSDPESYEALSNLNEKGQCGATKLGGYSLLVAVRFLGGQKRERSRILTDTNRRPVETSSDGKERPWSTHNDDSLDQKEQSIMVPAVTSGRF